MDELFPALLVIVIGIISTLSKAAKNQSRKAVESHRAAAEARTRTEPIVTPAMVFGDVPGQAAIPVFKPAPAAAPTVHPHIKPDCDTHDVPGSLGVTSMEGKDPCHEDELTLERTMDAAPQPESGLALEWSGENMVKAFVMQEVLTRPAQRRRAQ